MANPTALLYYVTDRAGTAVLSSTALSLKIFLPHEAGTTKPSFSTKATNTASMQGWEGAHKPAHAHTHQGHGPSTFLERDNNFLFSVFVLDLKVFSSYKSSKIINVI
jgi:hypothetical protein